MRQLGLNILIKGCCSPAVGVAPPAGAAAVGCTRRKIRLIEGNAKCCHLKTLKGTLRQVFICPEPPPPPAYTLYTCIHCTVYLFTQGREGGGIVEPDRLEGQQFTKLDQNTNMTVHIFSL